MANLYKRYLSPLYPAKRFYFLLVGIIMVFVISYGVPVLLIVGKIAFLFLLALALLDYIVLFAGKNKINASRQMAERFSNGDENKVFLAVSNKYPFAVHIDLVDEVPFQFQMRNFSLSFLLGGSADKSILYNIRPTQRGEYVFYNINLFVKSPLRLMTKRVTIEAKRSIKVFPSFFQLRRYELKAHSSNLAEAGNKKMRKLGQSLEFEQIKEYVTGDDIRTINWKATARKGQMMVNNFTDEKSQHVYCFIDKSRVMKMPFEGMTLLDYAINASVILSRVALIKQDRAGLVTFSEKIGTFLPAERKAGQMNTILTTLYDQQTNFGEGDMEKLYALVKTRISQRGLVVLFTNFESMSGLQRQLPYIRAIARIHLVLVVFFENTEIKTLTDTDVRDIEGLYIKTIAEKYIHEKKLIAKELQQHGILTILTTPERLTIDSVNKYLELKARQAI
jgi:uncharacterized protein (DUF58 family)